MMLGRIQCLGCYQLLLKRLNPSCPQPGAAEKGKGVEEVRDNPGWVSAALRMGTGKPPQGT